MSVGKILETAFEQYQLSTVLGEGGAGRVYAATNSRGEAVAIKLLTPELATSLRRRRFQNEIEFCRRTRHPNVIRVLDVGVDLQAGKAAPFYVMPKFGGTLRHVLRTGQKPDQLLRYFAQILDGVEAAHLLGVFHRDLKPENILHDQANDSLVVADFGIAHFSEDFLVAPVETVPVERLANFVYSAPEQRQKGANVDRQADIFALGLILNEMLTGSVPHGVDYPRVEKTHPALSYLDGLIEEMIKQNPAARSVSIEAIKRQLIGRKNEFVALQELRAKQAEVVPTTVPSEFQPIGIREVDWDANVLTLTLSRAPEDGFILRFRSPKHTMHTYGSFHHRSFVFRGDRVFVDGVRDSQAPGVVDLFKKHLGPANVEFVEDLAEQAAQRDRDLREALAAETARAEQRAAVLARLRITSQPL